MRWKKFIRSDTFFYSSFIILFLLIALHPLWYKNSITPSGYIYTMAKYSYMDYYGYLSDMQGGCSRYWLVQHPFVNTPHKRTLLFIFYHFLGKVSCVLKLPYVGVYYTVLYGSVIVFTISVIVLLKTILPRMLQRGAFLLIFLSGMFPKLAIEHGRIVFNDSSPGFLFWKFPDYSFWEWTRYWESPYHRFTPVPHHGMAEVLFIITVYLFIRFNKQKRIRLLIPATIIQVVSAFIFPTPTTILVIVVGCALFVTAIREGVTSSNRVVYLGCIAFIALVLFPLIFLRLQIVGYPWNVENPNVGLWYFQQQLPMMRDYLLIFGPLLLCIPFAMTSRQLRTWPKLLITVLFFLPFLLLVIFPYMGVSGWRALNGVPFVWAGILAIVGIDRIHQSSLFRWSIVVIIILISLPQALFFLQWDTKPPWYERQKEYILQSEMRALAYLQQTATFGEIVLSTEQMAVIINALTPERGFLSYYAEHGLVPANDQGLVKATAFYQGRLPDDQATVFLKEEKIKYVLGDWGGNVLSTGRYLFLSPVFTEGETVLYKVNF